MHTPVLRTTCVSAVLLSILVPAIAEAQLGGLIRRGTRAATDELGDEIERKVREGVRCVVGDTQCIDRARSEGKTPVMTDRDGKIYSWFPPTVENGVILPFRICRGDGWKGPDDCEALPRDALFCRIVVVDGPVDWEVNGNVYTIESAEKWINCGGNEAWAKNIPIGFTAFIRVDALMNGEHGFQRVAIEREAFNHREVGPMLVPHTVKERISGVAHGIPEIVKEIQAIRFNEGPPTQAEIAAIIAAVTGAPGQ